MIVLLVGGRYLLARPSFFTQDDFIYLAQADRRGLTWDWLDAEWFQHFAPAHRFAFWLLDATPAWWTAVLSFELVLLALALWAFHASLVLLFGRSWKLLVPVVLLGSSLTLAPSLLWPSAGLQNLPALACTLGALWSYLRYHASGEDRWIAVTAGLMAIGLLFYIRPLLIPLYLLAVRVLLLQADLRPRVVGRALWVERRLWGALGAVAVVYLGHYTIGGFRGDPGPHPSLDTIAAFVRIEWLRNIWPAAIGQEVHQVPSLPAADLRAEVLGQVLFALLLAASLALKRWGAWRGWALVAVGVATTLLLVGFGRLGLLGTGVGYDLRYITDLAWLVPLGVLFALDPRRVLDVGRSASAGRPRPLALVVVVVATGACAANALHSAALKEDAWFGHDTRAWADHARGTLRALREEGSPVRVRDGVVPGYVLVGTFAPYNRLSLLLPTLGEPVAFSPDGAVVGSDGRVHQSR